MDAGCPRFRFLVSSLFSISLCFDDTCSLFRDAASERERERERERALLGTISITGSLLQQPVYEYVYVSDMHVYIRLFLLQ